MPKSAQIRLAQLVIWTEPGVCFSDFNSEKMVPRTFITITEPGSFKVLILSMYPGLGEGLGEERIHHKLWGGDWGGEERGGGGVGETVAAKTASQREFYALQSKVRAPGTLHHPSDRHVPVLYRQNVCLVFQVTPVRLKCD